MRTATRAAGTPGRMRGPSSGYTFRGVMELGTAGHRGAPCRSARVGLGRAVVSNHRSWVGYIPMPRGPSAPCPSAGPACEPAPRGGAVLAGRGEWGSAGIHSGGAAVPSTCHSGSPRPGQQAGSWEQLATGRLNREPLSSVCAGPARSGQLTVQGMPRPAPSVSLLGSMWRWNSWPWSPPAGLRHGDLAPPQEHLLARARQRVTLHRPCPGCPHPRLRWWHGPSPHIRLSSRPPVCLVKSYLPPEHTGISLLTQEAFEGPGGPVRGPPAELACVASMGLQGGRAAFCPAAQPLLPSVPTPPAHKAACLIPGSQASHSL